MGWIILEPTSETTIKFFSVADEIELFRESFLDFVLTLSPSFFIFMICLVVGFIIFYMLASIAIAVREQI